MAVKMASFDRVNKIIKNETFLKYLRLNEEAEAEREFCRHDMGHFLDVARIAQILNLKEDLQAAEELLYAAALLHDIGRHIQYASGTPHEEAGAALAPAILKECGFGQEETETVIKAIAAHRTESAASEPGLTGLLYRADKLSRSCFACKAEERCDWKKDKKNRELIW